MVTVGHRLRKERLPDRLIRHMVKPRHGGGLPRGDDLEPSLKEIMLASRRWAWDLFNQPSKGPYFTRLRQKGNLVYPRCGPQFRRTAVHCRCSTIGSTLAEHAQSPGLDPKAHHKLDAMTQACNPSTLAEVRASEIQGHLWLCIGLRPALAVKDHIWRKK